jgi:hypothetical protein
MLPLLPCLIESRSPERQLGQISTLLLRFSSLAQVMMAAMVVMLIMLLSGCQPTRHLMRLAPSIELVDMTMVPNALSKSSARTALQIRDAGTKITTSSTTPMSLVPSKERKP